MWCVCQTNKKKERVCNQTGLGWFGLVSGGFGFWSPKQIAEHVSMYMGQREKGGEKAPTNITASFVL